MICAARHKLINAKVKRCVANTQNLCSAFNPSKVHTHTAVNTHTHRDEHTPGAVGSHIAAAPGEQLRVWCLSQGSHLSCGIEGERERWLFTPKSKWLDN